MTPYLTRIRWRLRLRDGLELAQRTLWLAMAVALFVEITGRLFPIELSGWLWPPLAIWLAGNLGYALFRPLSAMHTARQADYELFLKERLSTSLALDAGRGSLVYASFDPELIDKAQEDALSTARSIRPSRDFPLRIERTPLLVASGILAALLVSTYLPNPMDAVIIERQAVAEEAERQAAEIEKTRDEIAQITEMTPEERDDLLRRLEEIAEKLRSNPGDRKQALADLSRFEEALRQSLDPMGDQRRAALEGMAAQLQAMAKNENPQIGDLEAAAEALEELARQMENMSAEEREALAQQLAQMAARAAQAGDGSLAQALSTMGQAAQSGNLEAARSAAEQAAQAMQQAQSDLASQQALNQALSQLQASRQSISGAGQQMAQAQQGQGQMPGQEQNPGQGAGQGQASGGGGGTNANQLPPSTRSGTAGDPQGQGINTGTSNLDSQVYVPREKPGGSSNEELYVPGQDTDQGETQSSEKPDPLGGLNNPALVPYNEVFQQYHDAASQAIDQSAIPPGLKDYIREYFTQLEP